MNIRSITHHTNIFSIQHYVIKIVSDLQQIGGFLRVFRFPPPINLTATISELAKIVGLVGPAQQNNGQSD